MENVVASGHECNAWCVDGIHAETVLCHQDFTETDVLAHYRTFEEGHRILAVRHAAEIDLYRTWKNTSEKWRDELGNIVTKLTWERTRDTHNACVLFVRPKTPGATYEDA